MESTVSQDASGNETEPTPQTSDPSQDNTNVGDGESSKQDEEDSTTRDVAEQEGSDQTGEESKKVEAENREPEQPLGDQVEKDDDGEAITESVAIADDAITDGEKQEAKQDKMLDLQVQQDQSEISEEKSEESKDPEVQEGEGKQETTEEPAAENEEIVQQKPPEETTVPAPSERPVTEHSSISEQSDASRKEKDRKGKKKDKKQKRKSKQEGSDQPYTKPKKKSSKSDRLSTTGGGTTVKQLEVILLSMFQPYDTDGSGYLQPSDFWEVVQSSELNLQLSAEEVSLLQGFLEPDRSGQISYTDFARQAAEILASLYQNQPASDDHWVELKTRDGGVAVYYNKQTGEMRDVSEAQGGDLFAGVIEEMFQLADSDQKGYVNKDEFAQMLQSEQMLAYLQSEDIEQMQQYFDSIPSGQATYEVFYPLAKELILRVYRVKDPSESEWCKLNSPQVGLFWFNKFTGETKKAVADDREQEIAFLNQAYAQVEETNFELEQYKQENRELQNALAHANEEQETLAAQLYETGHALDEATSEIKTKELELDQMRDVVGSKEREIEALRSQVNEMERVKQTLTQTEQELTSARETIATRDKTMTDRDSNIMNLQREIDAITDRLKTANGIIDARDSSESTLRRELQDACVKVQELEKNLSEMENQKTSTEQELKSTKQLLEEKMANLATSRKHLKNARERNMDMEKELDKLRQTHDKLRNSECEIQTLKSFLTTKTALVEKRKKELRDAKVKVAELEEKDSRRAVILADVLEKTARQYQQQLVTPGAMGGSVSPLGKKLMPQTPLLLDELRPASAPAFPPEGEKTLESVNVTYKPAPMQSPRFMKTYTMDGGTTGPTLQTQTTRKTGRKSKPKARSRTVPKLPPIRKHLPARRETSTFVFPTSNELSRHYKEQDATVYDHATSNPQCQCELCKMNSSIVAPNGLRPETGLTGIATQTAVSGYQSETDPRELALYQQIRIGQRVIVRVKKSQFDLEPQKLTGIVKYVGTIDSEYVDNRLYVGVKLDEAVGNTDGLIKGKRYFTCPSKHGKVVRINDIVAVLPRKSVFYKPLQGGNKRSPYSMQAQRKSSSIKVT